MNEKVENLILEHLRVIRADMRKMADDIHTLRAEMIAMRAHMGGFTSLQDHDHTDIAAIKLRLDRIEQRLDLVD
jgi:predicted lipoprotein